jgi:8-oxo-dGTP pyrophosphatase MutT (NUDIX family)
MTPDLASLCLPDRYEGPTGVTALLIQRIGRDIIVWLARRTESAGAFAGYWCSPGGKPNPGELLQDALAREIKEETSLEISPLRFDFVGVISISPRKDPVWLFLADLWSDETPLNEGDPALSAWEPFSLVQGPHESVDNLLLTPGTAALVAMARTRYDSR